MTALNNQVLVLNRAYVPVDVVCVKDAISSIYKDTAAIVDSDYSEYTWEDWYDLFSLPLNKEFDSDVKYVKDKHLKVRVPEVIILNDFKTVPKRQVKLTRRHLYIRDKGTCFTPDSMVLMHDYSLKPIHKVVVGDKVLDHNQETQRVEYVNRRHVKENLVKIKKVGLGESISCTKDHKILCSKDMLNIKEKKAEKIKSIKTHKKYNADFLFELAFDFTKNNNKYEINLFDFIKEDLRYSYVLNHGKYISNRNSQHKIKNNVKLNKDFGVFIGLFLAEGNLSKDKKRFSFCYNINETELIKLTIDLLEKIFNIKNYEIIENKSKNTCAIRVNRSIVGRFLYSFLYKKNKDKRINFSYINDLFLQGVIIGLTLGDGYVKNNKIEIMMSRIDLIKDIYISSNFIKIYPTLSKTSFRKDGRIYKSVIYQGKESEELNNLITSYMENRQFEYLKKEEDFLRGYKKINNNKIFSKAKSVEEFYYEGYVYDLEISNSHTYIVNFMAVHNCQYTGKKLSTKVATLDHVIPRSRGGKNTWGNLVLCDPKINRQKDNRTPEEAGLTLLKKPFKPKWHPVYASSLKNRPESWYKFVKKEDWSKCYWDVQLEDD